MLHPILGRLQWRKVVAVVDDHPKLAILSGSFVFFYATRLQGIAHFRESFSRWKVETFGGVHEVDRAVRMPDVILSFWTGDHDRLDVLSLTSVHLGGNAFREELSAMVKKGGKVRIVLLDPRISDSNSTTARVIIDRYKANEDASRFTKAFEDAWTAAASIDDSLAKQLLEYFDGSEK